MRLFNCFEYIKYKWVRIEITPMRGIKFAMVDDSHQCQKSI